jgi:hypothetical protein
LSDDPRLDGIPLSASDKDRTKERDQRLADLTARLRADNRRLAQRTVASPADIEFSGADEDQAQKRRSRFWELIDMLTNRERQGPEPDITHGSFPSSDLVDDPRIDANSVVERAALEAIAEALATPDISRDLASLQSLAEPHPYEPIKRAQRPLPLIGEGPAFVTPFKVSDNRNDDSDPDWQEVKAEALSLLEARSLEPASSHLAYIQERIRPVLDRGAMEGRSHESMGKAAQEVADHLTVVEHIKALQQGQKQMADAIALIDIHLRQFEADVPAAKTEARFEAIKETAQLLQSAQDVSQDKLTHLPVNVAQLENRDGAGNSLPSPSEEAASRRRPSRRKRGRNDQSGNNGGHSAAE